MNGGGGDRELKLCGEHINLSSRTRFSDEAVKRSAEMRFRPHSALHAPSSNKIPPEHNRRPFSAGTLPTSPKLHSFLRYTNAEKPSSYDAKNNDYAKAFTPPLSIEDVEEPSSSVRLFDKSKSIARRYQQRFDDASENGSVDTCISLGTKIKAKAQMTAEECCEVTGSPIKLKRNLAKRPSGTWMREQHQGGDVTGEINREVKEISIFVPSVANNNKDENTSSGVSSSSDLYYKDGSKTQMELGHNNSKWTDKEDLTGRVSFGNPHSAASDEELYSTFNAQLSLVEEESSAQDDDASSDGSSSRYRRQINVNKDRRFSKNDDKIEDSLQKTSEYLIAKYNEIRSSKVDDDIKFKTLEEKYRREKYDLLYSNDGTEDSSKSNNRIHSEDFTRKSPANNIYHATQDRIKQEETSTLRHDASPKTLFTIPEILIDELPEKDPKNDKKDEVDNNVSFKSKNTIGLVESKYPRYLQNTDSKSYTSKVIEDYKKEISAINSIHDLTIKDLRKKCDDLKEYIHDDSVESTPKKYLLTSTDDEEGVDEKVIEAHRKSDIILDIEKHKPSEGSELVHNYRYDPKANLVDSNESSLVNNGEKSYNYTQNNFDTKVKTLRSKLKKKIKKKDYSHGTKSGKTKNFIENNKLVSARKNCDTKKPQDNDAPNRKNNKVKFKAQKIALSKSTTKFNPFHRVDYDRDIVSWMATRCDSPMTTVEEKSANSPIFNNPNHFKRNNMVHFESDIVPILKEKTMSSNNHPALNDDSTTINADSYESKTMKSVVSKRDDSFSSVDSVDIMDHGCTELGDLIHDDNTKVVQSVPNATELQIAKISEEFDDGTTADYRDILKFLEKVEKSTNNDVSSLSHNQSPFVMKVEELMELGKAELAHRVVVGTLAANKAAEAAAGLREALIKAAQASAARLKAAKATARHQATTAALQTSQSLARHQKFIEQLVNEKKALTERIEQLATAASNAEARHKRGAKIAGERLQLELRNQRQRLSTVHQREKQAWLKHHTQKIKEMTIKGLESEIREIERNHSEQLNTLEQNKEAALEKLREQHSKEIRQLKDVLNQQIEDAIDKERMLSSERLEKKRLEWENALEAATERADKDAKDAARRAEESVKNARSQADMWKAEQEREFAKRKAALEQEIAEKKAMLMEEFAGLKEKMARELDDHKEEYSKNHMVALKNKEIEIRSSMRRERDREIEKAIDCMEVEAQEERREMQNTLRRIKEKYDKEMTMLEESEKLANERCQELRDQLREVQELYAVSQITITQLEGKLKQAEELQQQNNMRTEMLVRSTEAKNQENLNELRAQMQTLQTQHKDEMHKLFAKVKIVIARKDEAVTLARREVTSLRERCMRLEAKNAI